MASWQTIRSITRRSSRMLKVNLGECQQVSPCLKLRSQTAKNEFENPEHYSLGLAIINRPLALDGGRRKPGSKSKIRERRLQHERGKPRRIQKSLSTTFDCN